MGLVALCSARSSYWLGQDRGSDLALELGFGGAGGPGGYLPNHALFGADAAACTVPGPVARSRCRPFGGDGFANGL